MYTFLACSITIILPDVSVDETDTSILDRLMYHI